VILTHVVNILLTIVCFFVSVEAPEPAVEVTVEYESSGEAGRLDTHRPEGARADRSPEEEESDAVPETDTERTLRAVCSALLRYIESQRLSHSE
jgi:hypothetical protein